MSGNSDITPCFHYLSPSCVRLMEDHINLINVVMAHKKIQKCYKTCRKSEISTDNVPRILIIFLVETFARRKFRGINCRERQGSKSYFVDINFRAHMEFCRNFLILTLF